MINGALLRLHSCKGYIFWNAERVERRVVGTVDMRENTGYKGVPQGIEGTTGYKRDHRV